MRTVVVLALYAAIFAFLYYRETQTIPVVPATVAPSVFSEERVVKDLKHLSHNIGPRLIVKRF